MSFRTIILIMIIFAKISALVLSVLSARSDLKTFKIPNDLLITFLSAAFAYRILMLDAEGIRDCLTGMILPFIILWLFFRFRKIGAGDIKLFCVLGAFMGPVNILWCMLWSFLCGGIIAVTELIIYRISPEKSILKINAAVLTVPAVIMWIGGLYG